MTTVVVVRKAGVAVIAADALTTFGDTRLGPVYAADSKLFASGTTLIGMAGDAASFMAFEHALAGLPPGKRRLGSRAAIFDTLLQLHPRLKHDYFLNTKEEEDDPFESSQVTALLAHPNGIFGIYSYREVYEYERYWAIGSGCEFALGAMYAAWDRLDSAAEIAELGVRAGCEFDRNSSGPIELRSVRLKSGARPTSN